MGKESVPCPIIDRGSQGMRDECDGTAQCFLLDGLSFVADSQLLGIAIAGAYKGRSDTLTARVSSEITLRSRK